MIVIKKGPIDYTRYNRLPELCLTIEKQLVKLLELFDKGEVYLYDQDTKEFEKIIILPGKKPTNMSK